MAKKPKHSPVIVHPPRTDHVQPGDRVRVIPTGARATVVRTQGRSVVLEMDEAFAIPGASTRTYYSYPGELEVMPRVGTMGAEVLYAERDGERPESQGVTRLRVGRRGRGVERSPRVCGPLRGGWGERSRRHRGPPTPPSSEPSPHSRRISAAGLRHRDQHGCGQAQVEHQQRDRSHWPNLARMGGPQRIQAERAAVAAIAASMPAIPGAAPTRT